MINEYFGKMPGSYLFADIGRKIAAFTKANPDKTLIRLGIGDVTLPLAPAVVQAIKDAADEMGRQIKGYPAYEGYEFLRAAIAENDFKARGISIGEDEIFVNDGAKSDSANLGELFDTNCKVAVCDPVYPVYVNSNALAGRAGEYDAAAERWTNLVYLPCTEENGFVPELPKEKVDIIYLCYPNNPTGGVIKKDQLQEWVDWANKVGAVIMYDAAYEAYVSTEDVPRSIYECEGARTCAIELRSFSKNAGFTGTRLGYSVIPKDLVRDGQSLAKLWLARQEFKWNGVSYPVQRAGEAVYSPEGKKQTAEQVAYYLKNARTIRDGLENLGYTAYGGTDSPYVWLKTPNGMTSWEFFDVLLEKGNVAGTPGSGFGKCGEGFFRLTGFGKYEDTLTALDRIKGI